MIGRRIFTDINEFEPTAWAGVLRLSKFHDTHCITLYLPRGEIVMADVAKCAAPTELILFELARLVGRNVGLRGRQPLQYSYRGCHGRGNKSVAKQSTGGTKQ